MKFAEQHPGFVPPYQDAETLAEHLCVTVRTIDEWVKIGKLPPPRVKQGKTRLWKWADLSSIVIRPSDCRPRVRAEGVIYFLRCENFIKIGFSKNIRSRLRGYRVDNPMPITVLHTMPGTIADEADLLLKFAHLKHRGEWFNVTPKLLAFIKSLQAKA